MDVHKEKARLLQILIEDNFLASKQCRETLETISEVSLRYYFQKLASQRSRFAMELTTLIAHVGDKNPYFPVSTFGKKWNDISELNKYRNIRRTLKIYKAGIKKYKHSLSGCNDGKSREVLIRHKAELAVNIAELRVILNLHKIRRSRRSGRTHSSLQNMADGSYS